MGTQVLTLDIKDATKEHLNGDGLAWDIARVKIDVVIHNNKELSNVLNSIRYLRGGAPKK
jgi:hypothetical protein